MSGHTEGPWRSVCWHDEYAIQEASKPHSEIAVLPRGDDWPESKANARLIAAAPRTKEERDELLKVAKCLLDLFDRDFFNDDRWEELWDSAELAVDKAEGRP